jgi:hypothetical protein
MKPFAFCWIAGVILVAALSVGCSSGSKAGGSNAAALTGRTPAMDSRIKIEMEKHSGEMPHR